MENRDNILTLRDEDGNEIEFEYLDTINFKNREFIVLLPLDELEDEDGEVVILEMKNFDGDNEEFIPVEDEQLLQDVFEEFKEKMKDEFDFVD